MMKRTAIALCALLAAADARAAAPRDVTITATRVHVGDVLDGTDADVAAVDIGPSPTAGASRVITRAEIVAAVSAKQLAAPAAVPDAVRVVRKAKRLSPADLESIVRAAVAAKPLGRGVRLDAVRAEHPIDVPDGWGRVDVDVPRAPKRVGSFPTTVIASFFTGDGEVTARVPVPIELAVSADGAGYDVERGSAVTLVVRRGYVEVRAAAVTTTDADVGDPVQVQLRGSGRVLRARLLDRDQALAVEDGQ